MEGNVSFVLHSGCIVAEYQVTQGSKESVSKILASQRLIFWFQYENYQGNEHSHGVYETIYDMLNKKAYMTTGWGLFYWEGLTLMG